MRLSDLAGKVILHSQAASLGGIAYIDGLYRLKMNGQFSWRAVDQTPVFNGNLLTAQSTAGSVRLKAYLPFSKAALYAYDLKDLLERAVQGMETLKDSKNWCAVHAQRMEEAKHLLEKCE